MEGCSKPETVPPGLGKTSATSGPPLSDPREKPHGEVDSFLTAARLVRRGWTEDVKKTGWQFSQSNCSASQPSLSRADGNQGPKRAEISLKDPRIVVDSRKTPENRENKADEATRTTDGAFTANRQAGRQADLCRRDGVVYIWRSGCRNTCKQSKRFKAPMLPVIAEM